MPMRGGFLLHKIVLKKKITDKMCENWCHISLSFLRAKHGHSVQVFFAWVIEYFFKFR